MKACMKVKVFLFIFLVSEMVCEDAAVKNTFQRWKQNHRKSYRSKKNESKAFQNFQHNLQNVEKFNKKFKEGRLSFKTKLNHLSDLSHDEKLSSLTGLLKNENKTVLKNVRRRDREKVEARILPPDALDYRKFGLVTEVSDQGFICSCCYAFSAQAALEGAIAKKYGILPKLSPQQLVDCNYDPINGNWGCNGGWMEASFEYLIGNNGTESEKTYPYTGEKKSCSFNSSRSVGFTMNSYAFVEGDEEMLKEALAEVGPLAVGINGGLESFFNYWTGIYDDPTCGDQLNHAMTLVGYGTDDSYSPPLVYWLLKNSWGTEWGEGGYMRLARGRNLCGITNYVVYPILN